MAITSNVTTSYDGSLSWDGSAFSNTLSYTVPAGANVLVVRLAGSPSGANDGITHNGKALTKVASINDGDQGNTHAWELLNPDVGAFDLVLTNSAETRTYRGFATCLSGVNTGVASTFATAAVYGTSTSAAVTTTADNFVLDIINIKTTQTATVGAGQTVDATAAASITNYHAYGSTEVATTTSTAMSWTFDISERTSQAAVAYTAASTGVSLTAPDTVTHGVATTATGGLLSTVTGMTLEYGTVAIAQTSVLNVADLDFTPDIGVPTLFGTVNAVDSLPLTPDSASAGTTPYQVTLDVTDGVTPASRNVTNVAAGSVQTFQVMAAGVNTTVGEGLGGSDLVVIEDNHQVTVPLVVDGVTLTIDPDTLDYSTTQAALPAGTSITFDATYYSPSLEQSSKIAVTITAPGGSGSNNLTDWIEANGAGGQVNEAWITYMKAAGASGTTFNDLMFSWLGGLGYTGSLSDRVAAWSKVSLN